MGTLKIILAHNYYQHPGGEDTIFAAEKALLGQMGHEVVEFARHNAEIHKLGRVKAGIGAVWSRDSQQALQRSISATHPDVAHFHNTFLLISPAAYYTCRAEGVPVVQTLHNYRLLCPGAQFVRNGRLCEDCLGKPVHWPGVLHGCWRDSKVQTGVVAAMLDAHQLLGTWKKQVDVYVALSRFARQKFIEGGLPARKIMIKPNCVYPDPGPGDRSGNYVLFVGRVSQEKGIRTLLQAWQKLKGVPLKVVGDGPLINAVRKANLEALEILGWCSHDEVLALIKGARFLVLPSEWYEGFPMTIAESFACGVSVVTSRLGVMGEIVEDGFTGLHFRAGDPLDLASKVEWAWTHPEKMAKMGQNARRMYETEYTEERNYEQLIQIYQRAMDNRI